MANTNAMNQKTTLPPESNVVILCHTDKNNGKRESGSGPIEPLLKFFTENKARYIFVIEQPHPLPDISLDCTMEVYKDGQLLATHTSDRFRWLYNIASERRVMKTYLRFKVRDVLAARQFLSQIPKLYPDCGPIHFLIGMESVNTLIGCGYRKALNVLKVIYYTFDWAPQRYHNRLMSAAFCALDKWACKCADVAWNVTDAIGEARRDILHYDMNRMAKQLTVHYGVEYRKGLVKEYDDLEKFKVIFSGGHHVDNGTQFLPDIARYVQEVNPKIKFIITSGGTMTNELKEKVREYGLHNTEFTGYIDGAENLDRLTCECLIGLAPYPDTSVSTKKYGDVIKIRAYFACGLTVVSTYVPPVSKEIREEGLGIVTGVDAKEMADAILQLCSDEGLLRKYRENVIRKAKDHNWTSIYKRAICQSME
jgi:glycosyltransferase involved in cell wall biosynthesis